MNVFEGVYCAYSANTATGHVPVATVTSGVHTVYAQHAAGSGAARHALVVNAATQNVVNHPNTGRENWQQVPVDVRLNAGWSTLGFHHRSAWAELDFVEVR